MRVAIVGAGAAGLASARHVVKNGFFCEVFEMCEQIGGTWIYSDDVGTDKYGFPVYSAMYRNLRTNLPQELMCFPDFALPIKGRSYITQKEVMNFLQEYADEFKLRPFIKTSCFVTEIRPLPDNKWQLTYIFKPTREETTNIYDAVMICNGHHNVPFTPQVKNMEMFVGEVNHSHNFRSAEAYQNKRVLTVGAGPSGIDISVEISKYAQKVYFSHHLRKLEKTVFPDNVQNKPDIKCIVNDTTVQFIDDSVCDVDVILFCTGYKYSFPFLHETCRITIDGNYVQPLYKHLIHLEKPTMCFIGIPFSICAFHMFDLQARYFCGYLNGTVQLPSTEEMRRHTKLDMEKRWARGFRKKDAHVMGEFQQDYYDDLAKNANTTPIAPVYVKLRDASFHNLLTDVLSFREKKFRIVDEHNFIILN